MSQISLRRARSGRQRGFLIMAGVFLIVVVGAFIAFLATQYNVQQTTSIDDLQSARALQAARAGVEWGGYQILRNTGDAFVTGCRGGPATKTLTFAGTSLAEFTTTLTCASTQPIEAGTTIYVYQLTSNACNAPSAGACPNATTTSAVYVDREVNATIACPAAC